MVTMENGWRLLGMIRLQHAGHPDINFMTVVV